MNQTLKKCKKCELIFNKIEDFYKGRAICKFCLRKNTPVGRQFTIPKENWQQAIELYNSGKSKESIGKIINVSGSAVGRLLNKLGVKLRKDNQRQLIKNERIFENIDTEEKAYWLGFLATDGNVYGTRIQINLSIKDKDHLEKWAKFLDVDIPIKDRIRAGLGNRTEPHKLVSCAFRCRAMVEDLAKHGITERKSLTVKPWIGPEHLMKHYWRGCVDGDGWVASDRIGFCGNPMMVQGFVDYIKNTLNIEKPIVLDLKRKCFAKVTYSQYVEINKIKDFLYNDCCVALKRKVEIDCLNTPNKGHVGSLAISDSKIKEIIDLFYRQNMNKLAISKRLGLSYKTVRKYITLQQPNGLRNLE